MNIGKISSSHLDLKPLPSHLQNYIQSKKLSRLLFEPSGKY